MKDHAEALSRLMQRHQRWVVLTGAGISAASGIPTYRHRDGAKVVSLASLGAVVPAARSQGVVASTDSITHVCEQFKGVKDNELRQHWGIVFCFNIWY